MEPWSSYPLNHLSRPALFLFSETGSHTHYVPEEYFELPTGMKSPVWATKPGPCVTFESFSSLFLSEGRKNLYRNSILLQTLN